MKLQTAINYRFLSLLLLVFMAAGIFIYITLGVVVNHHLDNSLRYKSVVFKKKFTDHYTANTIEGSFDKSVVVKCTGAPITHDGYSDTLIFNPRDKEWDVHRKLIFGFNSSGKYYQATMVAAKIEAEDLVEFIFYLMLTLFALIVLILFFLNRWLSHSLWNPFYKTLNQLRTFRIDERTTVHFEPTHVYEFEQLNISLQDMMQKMQTDFKNLKEFTENASHEIQTPLAIIQTKLENILQDKTLSTQQHEQIQLVYKTANRLSKLNEALLLLSKIENKQFPDSTEINLVKLLKQRLDLIQELIEFKNINVEFSTNAPFNVEMNAYLAEILINNLLGNAVKHNINGGRISVVESADKLIIANTGHPLTLSPDQLFHRFTKQNAGNESTGLGLSIASEICIKSGLRLQYHYHDPMHELIISNTSSKINTH